jgi:RNA polymerase sigma-70 factor (ECF subfamily)
MTGSSSGAEQIEQHRAAVTRYLRYLIHDAAEAEDLAQETFLRAHRQLETLRDPGALESWLYQIATHASIDRLRQRARLAERLVDTPAEDLPISDEKQSSPFTIAQQQEMSACVQQYVAKLSDAYKAILLLHDAEGLTANEIADLLPLPITTVKMRLHRARRQLQQLLTDACAFGHDDRNVFVCEPKPKSK